MPERVRARREAGEEETLGDAFLIVGLERVLLDRERWLDELAEEEAALAAFVGLSPASVALDVGEAPLAPVAEPADYHRWLAPVAETLDIWETTYLHELTGPDPVFQWFRGSWLRPILARLDDAGAAAFEAEYRAALAALYPPDESGTVLMPFRRVFVVASPAPRDR